MKTILITGGAGLIGSTLANHLIDQKFKVIIIDDLSTGKKSNLKKSTKMSFYKSNIMNLKLLSKLIKKSDFVFHFAASLGLKNIMSKKILSIKTNVEGTHNVLELCSKFNKKVVIASSSEIYGLNYKKKLKEQDISIIGNSKKFRWSYAVSKLIDEHLSLAYFNEKKLKVNILRFFNTVGSRQNSNYGMVIPAFIKSAIKNKPIIVFGNGKQTRTFLHVNDAVGFIKKIISEKSFGNIYNLGGNENVSIINLAKKIKKLSKSKSKIIFKNYKYSYSNKGKFQDDYEDILKRHPDTSLIKKKFKFNPKYSLKDIIKEYIQWYKKF